MKNSPSLYHLQSFALMTHRKGLELIYEDFKMRLLILKVDNKSCTVSPGFSFPEKMSIIFTYEIGMTQTFLSRNISIKSLALGWQNIDLRDTEGVNRICMNQEDQYHHKWYFGGDLNPFEVIFYKTNTANFDRVDMKQLDLYTVLFDERVGYYAHTDNS